jgi:hypothetical protein
MKYEKEMQIHNSSFILHNFAYRHPSAAQKATIGPLP